jgi:hypothetical protein
VCALIVPAGRCPERASPRSIAGARDPAELERLETDRARLTIQHWIVGSSSETASTSFGSVAAERPPRAALREDEQHVLGELIGHVLHRASAGWPSPSTTTARTSASHGRIRGCRCAK